MLFYQKILDLIRGQVGVIQFMDWHLSQSMSEELVYEGRSETHQVFANYCVMVYLERAKSTLF